MSKKSDVPRTARINGRRWRIVVVETLQDTDGEPNLGQCDRDDRAILLRAGPTHQLQDVLFHELVHAACPTLDEDTVLEVERGVYAVLSDNPALRRWLFGNPRGADGSC
ncbi:MAG: hypothetical protein J5J04_17265 [Anaerolineae bacterium]|nr:hypothetical protein [Anaerolineae bacterium]